ncbi:hypothetical protein [Streptomyces flaveolus]|uniref:hypothetical protein n=1 Tax=Streptomyces flaveolus TaxID=67297 RepID=UPI003701861C
MAREFLLPCPRRPPGRQKGTLVAPAGSENVITCPCCPSMAESNWWRMPSRSLAGRRREDM